MAFKVELASAIEQIGESPATYPIVEDASRRFMLHRFPYSVLYTIAPGGVLVIAVAHQHQKPGYWRRR
jgi:toxin ParE2